MEIKINNQFRSQISHNKNGYFIDGYEDFIIFPIYKDSESKVFVFQYMKTFPLEEIKRIINDSFPNVDKCADDRKISAQSCRNCANEDSERFSYLEKSLTLLV